MFVDDVHLRQRPDRDITALRPAGARCGHRVTGLGRSEVEDLWKTLEFNQPNYKTNWD